MRIASRNLSGSAPLPRNPLAPARSAWKTYPSISKYPRAGQLVVGTDQVGGGETVQVGGMRISHHSHVGAGGSGHVDSFAAGGTSLTTCISGAALMTTVKLSMTLHPVFRNVHSGHIANPMAQCLYALLDERGRGRRDHRRGAEVEFRQERGTNGDEHPEELDRAAYELEMAWRHTPTPLSALFRRARGLRNQAGPRQRYCARLACCAKREWWNVVLGPIPWVVSGVVGIPVTHWSAS